MFIVVLYLTFWLSPMNPGRSFNILSVSAIVIVIQVMCDVSWNNEATSKEGLRQGVAEGLWWRKGSSESCLL